jgi:secreted trypsin-like serine protease
MSCGVKRIIYRDALSNKPGSWPWHVALYRVEDGSDVPEFACGATLVNRNTVITSANCLTSSKGAVLNPADFVVYLGKSLMESNDKWTIVSNVNSVIRHPNFKGNEMEVIMNDVGILKLEEDVKFNSYIQPICLPKMDTRLFGKNGIVSSRIF